MRSRLLPVIACAALMIGAVQMQALAQSRETPEALKAASELYALLNKGVVEQMVAAVIPVLWPSVETELTAAKLDPPTMAGLRKEFERIQAENLGKTTDGAPAVYARHFTLSEMQQLIAFYRTPAGQKLTEQMPQLAAETLAIITPRLQEAQAQSFLQFQALLRQRGYIH
jgi:hypothetical protein